uniref:Putative peroxisomal bioproteinsis protein peroxin n=1 Tax=Ixodes ricinus TaxID=34613 RepID=A0A0K8RC70_IXORI
MQNSLENSTDDELKILNIQAPPLCILTPLPVLLKPIFYFPLHISATVWFTGVVNTVAPQALHNKCKVDTGNLQQYFPQSRPIQFQVSHLPNVLLCTSALFYNFLSRSLSFRHDIYQ